MPGFYAKCEYDLAGFAVGAVERENVLDLSKYATALFSFWLRLSFGFCRVAVDDVILGLPSSGLHSNGFSLVRKVVREKANLRYSDPCPWDGSMTIGKSDTIFL